MKTERKIEINYEVMLRQQDERELIVNVRTTVEDENGYEVLDESGDAILDEYEEGFSFTEPTETERYREARRKFNELLRKYSDKMVDQDNQHPERSHSLTESDEVFWKARQLVKIKQEEDGVAMLTLG